MPLEKYLNLVCITFYTEYAYLGISQINKYTFYRCKTSGDRWYVGNRCEKEIRNKGTVWTMSSLCALLSLFMLTLVNVV